MRSDARVRPFNETPRISPVADGNHTSKWKTLMEKHREDVRNVWNNKSKWQKLVLEVHIQNATRFARAMYGLMVFFGLLYYGLRYWTNGHIDLYFFLPVLLLQIMVVTLSRLLVMGQRVKYHVYIMIAIFIVLAFWGLIAYDYIVRRVFDWRVHGIFLGVICPLLLFVFGWGICQFLKAVVYQHNNELPALASQLSIQFLGALPLMLLFASDSVTQILSVPTLFNNMCALMPGTTPPEPPERFYRNCTRSYFDLMSEDIPINLMYTSTDVVTDNTTVVELYNKLELKGAIEDYIPVVCQSIFKMFQALEIILVMCTSIIMSRICRLSYRDFFAGRTTPVEMTFLISTVGCLYWEYVMSGLSMAPAFSSPYQYVRFVMLGLTPFFPAWFLRLVCAIKLINNGLRVIQMEADIDSKLRADLSKVERETAYSEIKKKYSYGVFVIHRRSLETIANGEGVDVFDVC